MPQDLQELSPRPDLDSIDSAPTRIPKLGVRGRTEKDSPAVISVTPSISTINQPLSEKAESMRSSEEGTLPPSPDEKAGAVAPWDHGEKKRENKYEPRSPTTASFRRPSTAHDESFTTATNGRYSTDAVKQPFRAEVSHHDKCV
jgi:hypothetical protein